MKTIKYFIFMMRFQRNLHVPFVPRLISSIKHAKRAREIRSQIRKKAGEQV